MSQNIKQKLPLHLNLKIFIRNLCTLSICVILFACHQNARFDICAVKSISITPAISYVIGGGSEQFKAIGRFANGFTRDITTNVTWYSSNIDVATIALSTGIATGVLPGLPTIITADLPVSCRKNQNIPNQPAELVVLPQFAYVVQEIDGLAVMKCNISVKTGQFSDCVDSGSDNFMHPYGATIYRFGTQTFVYVANQTGPVPIFQCLINPSSGLFDEGCQNAGGMLPGNAPNDINFYIPQNGQLYAYILSYILPSYSPTVYQCTVDSTTGSLLVCTNLAPSSLSFAVAQMTFNTIGSQGYAYVTENFFPIVQFKVNSAGSFSDAQSMDLGFGTTAVAFVTFGDKTYAYLTRQRTQAKSIVQQCAVDSNTGDFIIPSCVIASPFVFDRPYNIKFVALKNGIYAYVAGFGPNAPGPGNVTQCRLDIPSMNLTDCMELGAVTLTNPTSVNFY